MRRDDLIAVMESFKGVSESPPGSNRTPIGDEFGWNGVAWCAETVSVACTRLGFSLHEAAVIRVEQRAKEGFRGMSWTRVPTLASAVCFDFGGRGRYGDMHTGLVTNVRRGGRFDTIEGNYHDRCDQVLRDMTYVRGFAVFPFEEVATPPLAEVPQVQVAPHEPDLTEKLMQAPVLKKGSDDRHHVGIMQSLLTWHAGDLTGDKNQFVDGDFGMNTLRVLHQWQERTQGLEADGVCGPKTWAWLCGV